MNVVRAIKDRLNVKEIAQLRLKLLEFCFGQPPDITRVALRYLSNVLFASPVGHASVAFGILANFRQG